MDISYLLFLQKAREVCGGVFDNFMLQATALGEGTVTFLLLAVMYWCVDKQIGQYMGFHVALGCTLNQFLKPLYHIERPWLRDERIHPVEAALPGAGGYSFPSGHTARAMAVWGSAGSATWKKSSWRLFSIICWLVTGLVMFSRNYLGVHTPQDVLASFLLGVLLLWLTAKLLILAQRRPSWDIFICLGGCILCFLPMLRIGCMSNAGAGMGFFIGWFVERRWIRFEVNGNLSERLTRLGAGGVLLLFVWKAAGPVLTLFMEAKYAGFFTSWIMAVYIMAGYPFLWGIWERTTEKYRIRTAIVLSCLFLAVLTGAVVLWQVRRNLQNTDQAKAVQTEPEISGAEADIGDPQQIESESLQVIEEERLQIIAHRGYSDVFPENTLEAFGGAIDIGADYIELDVQRTGDGQIVVFHDGDLLRITGAEGRIADYSYEELLQMDAGSWFSGSFAGAHIPTLEEALTLIGESDLKVYLELKDIGQADEFVEAVVETARQCGMENRCVFASFNYQYLAQIKESDSSLKVLYNTTSGKRTLPQENPAEYYGLWVQSVTIDTVRAIHEAGSRVFVWTADTPQQIRNLQAMGVDGIVTNNPGRAAVVVHPEYGFLTERFQRSITMPGLYEPDKAEERLEDYVVQGLTKAGDKLIISAYSYSGERNSILFVMDIEGRLLHIVDLGFQAHMGGIAYDEKRDLLWVTGASGHVYALSASAILENQYHGEILADFDAGLVNHNGAHVASFLNLYGDKLFVGSYVDGGNGLLKRYDMTQYQTPVEEFTAEIPERIQGVTWKEDVLEGNHYMMLSQGYQIEDSHLLVFLYRDEIDRYEEPLLSEILPEGVEQIQMTADGMYLLFESAARPYRATARIPNDQIWLIRI